MKQTYCKYIGLYLLLFLFSINFYAQENSSIWVKTSRENALKESKLSQKEEIKKAKYYQLDLVRLSTLLKNIPSRKNSKKTSGIILSFPDKNGQLQPYRIKEAPLFEENFQEKHPNMRCYIGEHVNNSGAMIRFSITPKGFHGMTLSPTKPVEFIDPVSYGTKNYMIYAKADLEPNKNSFECKFIDDLNQAKLSSNIKALESLNANDGTLRTYELALACTAEYAEYHWGSNGANLPPGASDTNKKNAVIAAMMVTMNRVNGIFERDLSLTMTMVDNTSIIFLDPDTDPYENTVNQTMLNANQTAIDNALGSNGYDIGHVFCTDNGGLATLNGPCNSVTKAKGATGLPNPTGDVFDVEYVAHEMGHQFGARHTWSSENGACVVADPPNQQWSPSSSYEPGSGSTIMAYAGLCAPDNVQSNGDDYFHQISIQEIWANISSNSCDEESSAGNNAPIANAGNDYSIPISTPYKLTGSSSDDDGTGTHTFTWEQYDLAASQGSITESSTTGPLVRSLYPTTNPVRYIPSFEDLRISNGSTTWEKLASVPRTLNFQLTVRDNGSGVSAYGQTATDGMQVNVVNNGGAFKVTSQNTLGISYTVGSTQTVEWDVAGTDSNPINTTNVNIKLSIDGGLTYPYLLLDSTSNDGSAEVTLPAGVAAPFCRIMVEADPAENIFFNINEVDFAIGYTVTETCNIYSGGTDLPLTIIDGGSSFQRSKITVSESTSITDINIGVDITHTYKGDLQIALLSPQSTAINLITPGSCSSGSLIITFDDYASTIDCANTEGNEVYKPENPLSTFNGENPSGDWDLGVIDLATDDTGTLNSWFIELCTTTVTLSNPDFYDFVNNLTVFPNPNRGDFTVKFSNASASTIDLEIYDLRGRTIYSKEYLNVTSFNESINMSHAQSGMYILNVSDGIRKTTKKIIIR
ncbi:zinc-dependent metalloprotease [Seonamhaeicola aphaedonensis]|uniref:Putative secreted protein (Por secretion system target) n=1 Tax=Seonamhaeicola aphaedonensis TaxID=1461338 RepID=A0A3D9HM79_9FLAO|nr:zinc-dependent metalloprotease family protein [Seonamhaeicola aphaedonensis]RED50588.1 putative secreted protein (Por secretion system target) [Seonamhaeicola aphaedonensis]